MRKRCLVLLLASCLFLRPAVASAQLPAEIRQPLTNGYASLPKEIRNNPAVKNTARQWGIAPKPVSRVKDNCSNCVALTFDDGPVAHTAEVLKLLRERGARASFFVTAGNAKRHSSLVRRMAPMTVGNHTVSHRELDKLSYEQVTDELARTNEVISSLTGSSPRWMRPPYGAINDTVVKAAARQGLAVAMWDVDTLDWKYKDPQRTCRIAVEESKAGSIVLMHDIHATTVDAVACIVDGLRKKGLEPVSLDELVKTPVPGKVYTKKD